MDRERLERCLERVAAYKASGLKASVWAQANEVSIRDLSSWCAHAQRWQARLDGVPTSAPAPKVGGFVAARVPAAIAATVRIEWHAGSTRVELHWPVANARELATWLREVGR
mmetsp:Transcript_39084/g.91556  ORF Transcript_39084/g.91556 Transcript_39084/m.91556 type:complete len:112 (-) Transcript_39084:300-635(-)